MTGCSHPLRPQHEVPTHAPDMIALQAGKATVGVADQVGSRPDHDAEMAGVGVGAHVGHAQQPAAVVPQLQASRIVCKLPPKDTLCVGTRLVDEAVDDAVEEGPLHGMPSHGSGLNMQVLNLHVKAGKSGLREQSCLSLSSSAGVASTSTLFTDLHAACTQMPPGRSCLGSRDQR